jgi:hypothetical protein
MPPIDPDIPPHKTRAFWYFIAFAAFITIAYPFVVHSHMSFWLQAVSAVLLFLVMVCIGWFAVRRVQRGETGPSTVKVVLLIVLGIIVLILDRVFKGHLW